MALTVQIILRVPWFRGSCDSMLQQSSLAMPWHFSFISEIQLIRGTCANSRASVKCNLAPKQQRQKRTSAKKGHRFLQASNAPRSACKPLPCKRFLTFRWWIPVDIGGSLTMEPWGSNVAIFKGKSTGKPHISWENRWFPVDFPLNQSIDCGFWLDVTQKMCVFFESCPSLESFEGLGSRSVSCDAPGLNSSTHLYPAMRWGLKDDFPLNIWRFPESWGYPKIWMVL